MDTQETQAPEVQPETSKPATPAEVVNNTDTAGEHMIPKSRFDEVNQQLKELKKAQEAAAKAQAQQEQAIAEEQGKFQELYRKAQAELEQAQAKAAAAEKAQLRAMIAAKTQLPEALIDRLRGDTAEELEADAKFLLDLIPKPAPQTYTGAAAGVNGKAPAPSKSDDEIKEMANRLGVSFEHLKKQFVTN